MFMQSSISMLLVIASILCMLLYRLGVEVDVQHKVKSFKDLTSTLYPVFNTMYRSAFRQHNRLLSRAELKVDSIEFNILQVLEDYQIKRRKNEINRQLKTLADTLQAIGRRFEQSNPGPSLSRRRTRRMRRSEDQSIGWFGSWYTIYWNERRVIWIESAWRNGVRQWTKASFRSGRDSPKGKLCKAHLKTKSPPYSASSAKYSGQ